MGRQFAAILPLLWMMAGSRVAAPGSARPARAVAAADGCPFAVLMQETRFKDFVRHVESARTSRMSLSSPIRRTRSTSCATNGPSCAWCSSTKTIWKTFRINLSENPASMKLELKDFQEDAVEQLIKKLNPAKREVPKVATGRR
jgi:adenine-specific DNA-methyltransferase